MKTLAEIRLQRALAEVDRLRHVLADRTGERDHAYRRLAMATDSISADRSYWQTLAERAADESEAYCRQLRHHRLEPDSDFGTKPDPKVRTQCSSS